jgi:hypothetical protein
MLPSTYPSSPGCPKAHHARASVHFGSILHPANKWAEADLQVNFMTVPRQARDVQAS